LFADTIEFLFEKPFVDESCCATDTGIDEDSMDRAIPGAGAALHAGIEVNDPSFSLYHRKDLVRTDLQTSATANAFLCIQLQC